MGMYVYKVTGKKVNLSNGEIANVGEFAYKPYRSFWKDEQSQNKKAERNAGIPYAEKQAKLGKRSAWVVHGDAVLKFPEAVGSYDDDYAFDKYLIKDVTPLK